MSQIKISETKFGRLSDKQEVKKYTIQNTKNDFEFSVISYGAAIQSVKVKDKNGKLTSVVLGFDTIEEYSNWDINPCFGAIVGRVANRISKAEFTLNSETYKLEKNSGEHCLHSGSTGLSRKNWASAIVENGVKFSYVSNDKEGGFPGEVWFDVIYRLDPNENKIILETKAITDKPTPVNITSHPYFNLAGEDTDSKIYDHQVKLYCDRYLDFNKQDVTVTGKINQVQNTKYDFQEFQKLSDRIKAGESWPEEGFDNYFILNESGNTKLEDGLRYMASVKNASNGLRLDVQSNQNGLMLYTGNFLNVKKSTSNGHTYSIHHGLCLEAHNYPDSVNHSSFPSCILNPDDEYSSKITYTFKVE